MDATGCRAVRANGASVEIPARHRLYQVRGAIGARRATWATRARHRRCLVPRAIQVIEDPLGTEARRAIVAILAPPRSVRRAIPASQAATDATDATAYLEIEVNGAKRATPARHRLCRVHLGSL
jgi:hypothetical protein